MNKSSGLFLAVGIWLIVAANFFLNLYDLDSVGVGLDDLLHFAGGLWLAGFLVYWKLPAQGGSASGGKIENWKLIIAIVLVVGIAWEIGEFIIDIYFKDRPDPMHDGLLDTGFDLLFDLLGASIFLLGWSVKRPLLLMAANSSKARWS